jgi:hypothetical protein
MVAFFEPIWEEIKGPLGFTRPKPPNATTIRRVLAGLYPEELQLAFEPWVQSLVKGKVFMASVDGKAMKNVKGESGLAAMLVNVFAHDMKVALAEYPIHAKQGEPTVIKGALRSLFDRYPGLKILTGDAAFAGRELNEAIIALGKDYVVQIKENQPKLKMEIEKWFEERVKWQTPAAQEVKKKVLERTVGSLG